MVSKEEFPNQSPFPADSVTMYILRLTKGFGAHNQMPASHSEGANDASEHLSDPYLLDLESAYDTLRGRIANGTYPTDIDLLKGTDLLAAKALTTTLIQEATEHGDTTRLDDYVESLLALAVPGDSPVTETIGFFTAAAAGNERAATVLHGLLQIEKEAEDWRQDQYALPEVPRTPMLDVVVRLCGKAAIPPDHWIDTYAMDAEHAWTLYARHYQDLIKAGAEEGAYLEGLEERVATGVGGLSDEWATKVLPAGVLPYIRRSDLRESVLERYIDTLSLHPPTDVNSLRRLEHVFSEVARDPAFADRGDVVDDLGELIASCTDALGLSVTGFATWKVDARLFRGASPQEALTYLNGLFAQDMNEVSEVEQQLIADIRDTKVAEYAQRFARKGDFRGAKTFLDSIANQQILEDAVSTCIAHTSTKEQLDAMMPNDAVLATTPDLDLQFQIATVQRQGNIDTLISLANTLTQSFRTTLLVRIQQAVASLDEQRGRELAGHLLATLRTQPDPKRDTTAIQALSQTLIRMGDTAEAERAYSTIRHEEPMARLWDTLRIVNARRGRGLPISRLVEFFVQRGDSYDGIA